MLTFATRWLPYGGGAAEDIMITFGTTPDVYFRRLKALLEDSDRPVDLDMNIAAALLHHVPPSIPARVDFEAGIRGPTMTALQF